MHEPCGFTDFEPLAPFGEDGGVGYNSTLNRVPLNFFQRQIRCGRADVKSQRPREFGGGGRDGSLNLDFGPSIFLYFAKILEARRADNLLDHGRGQDVNGDGR